MDDGFMDEAAAMEELHLDILEQKHAKAKVMLSQVRHGHPTVSLITLVECKFL